jgi:VWFA-related protein
MRSFFQTRRILDTFSALEAIANHVKGIPGRKNLLWISAGFPLAIGTPDTGGRADMSQVRTFGVEMERAVRALNSANIAVYPIDARGLSVGNPYINVSTMREMAQETGGTAYYNRNDLHRAVRTALDDSRDVYSLTYSP